MEKKRILAVDDEQINRTVMALLLTQARDQVSTAVNGLDALLQLRQDPPDLPISDLNMPQVSGFELLSIVRQIGELVEELGVRAPTGSSEA